MIKRKQYSYFFQRTEINKKFSFYLGVEVLKQLLNCSILMALEDVKFVMAFKRSAYLKIIKLGLINALLINKSSGTKIILYDALSFAIYNQIN